MGEYRKKQIHCVKNLSLEELASLFDHETGDCLHKFHPDIHKLIVKRIKQLHKLETKEY